MVRAPWLSACVILLAFAASGCLPAPYREVPHFERRFEQIKTVTLVPPKVAVYRLTAGGVEEEVQEWTDSARTLLTRAVERRALQTGHLTFVSYRGPEPSELEPTAGSEGTTAWDQGGADDERTALEETWSLFDAVVSEILTHTYNPNQTFKHKQASFDYTLGSEAAAVVEETGADAFLMVVATDHVATEGRQALIALGAAAAVFTGVYLGPGASPATVMLALVESKTGDILWFNAVHSNSADLRKRSSDEELVSLVMKGLVRE